MWDNYVLCMLLHVIVLPLIMTHEAAKQPPPPTTVESCKTGSFHGVLIVVMTIHCACCFIVTGEATIQPIPTTTMALGKTG